MKALTDQDVLDGIIKEMERGVLPWRKPWSQATRTSVIVGSIAHAPTWPSNLRAPQTPFGVFNGMILLGRAAAISDGYDASLEKTRLVYNLDQVQDCEKALGLTFSDRKAALPPLRYKKSAKLLKRLENDRALRIAYGEDKAAYRPSSDVVMLPERLQFSAPQPGTGSPDGEPDYWATLWHEVIHWTGHSSRLDRDRHRKWGDQIYAFEELIAELGSAFLCAYLGIEGEVQHASYLESWCRALKRDKARSLWDASTYATAAKDFVLRKQPAGRSLQQNGLRF